MINNKFVKFLSILIFLFLPFSVLAAMGKNSTSDEFTGRYLTTILRAARTAFYDLDTEKMDTNPAAAGVDLATMEALIKKKYLNLTGKKLEYETAGSRLMENAIKLVLEDAFKDRYKTKWANEKFYPNKLLPERFAREIGLKLKEISEGRFNLHISTIDDCLVNPDNKSDEWERKQIGEKFTVKTWDKTKGFYENLANERTDRFAFPNYFEKRCLTCHGGDEGKALHPNCPNMNLGAFGGIYSIILKY